MKKLLLILVSILLLSPISAFAQAGSVFTTGTTDINSNTVPYQGLPSLGGATQITPTAQQVQQAQQTLSGSSFTGVPSSFCNGQTCTYVPLEPLSPYQPTYPSIQSYLQTAFTVLISLGGLFAVTMLTLSGIRYMLSESGFDRNKAKDRIRSSLLGLLLLASAWLILFTINPQLLQFKLSNIGIGTYNQSGQVIPSAQAISCLDMSCLSEQQKASLSAVSQARQGQSVDVTSEDVANATSIQAGEASVCQSKGGTVFMGTAVNCSAGFMQAAKQSGFNNCFSLASGGVCATK